jgi:hypothetical protein
MCAVTNKLQYSFVHPLRGSFEQAFLITKLCIKLHVLHLTGAFLCVTTRVEAQDHLLWFGVNPGFAIHLIARFITRFATAKDDCTFFPPMGCPCYLMWMLLCSMLFNVAENTAFEIFCTLFKTSRALQGLSIVCARHARPNAVLVAIERVAYTDVIKRTRGPCASSLACIGRFVPLTW